MTDTTTRAADHLVDLLEAHGTTHVFGVPGESYLPVLDAFHGRNRIRFMTCRQEGGAAMAADAHARITGRPGVCMVTRGPGATNASAGVHVAYQDSTPLILFIGQVARDMVEREAFQEIDYRRMFGQMAKWVAEIDDASRLQEFISRAYRVAMSGRPGPVVLALPEDMLYDRITPPPAPRRAEAPRYLPAPEGLEGLRARLAGAERPLVMIGGGGWTETGRKALARFAETQGLPVTVSMRSQALIDNDHPNYVGHFAVARTPYLADALAESDLILAIGPRLGEMTTNGYMNPAPPVPAQKLVHVFPAPEEPGRVYEPDLALAADMQSFCEAVAGWDPIAPDRFAPRLAALKSKLISFADPATLPAPDPLAKMVAHLNDVLLEDAIVTNGAGNYAGWVHRFYRYRRHGSCLAPTSGSMGYGLPAAVGAAVAAPEREVICFAGDGCFMMTCQEMATAVQHGLRLTVIVVNNNRYGTIRAHQEREFPGHISGTALTNPDFAAFARSFGAAAVRVDTFDQFRDALAEARARGGVNLIEVAQDEGVLAPGVPLPQRG
ncbi:thiamine pyrophosphate-binding protein [Roseovarius faecimaris]|uniref:Thiamine pyrophosphate-binding protein n=1 Tax=Roseovarius faecimaris TaxID=2494550 RepID=A0A6I6IP28_9RHOB|nr:thiamine pyrophosphate-dependent enzyme [Roseovarius faecimaris]QGX97563.1 thiamine pyrophosphate-binding protein [Roseovarius faecimaris]